MFYSESNKQYKPHYISMSIMSIFGVLCGTCFVPVFVVANASALKDDGGVALAVLLIGGGIAYAIYAACVLKYLLSTGRNKYIFTNNEFSVIGFDKKENKYHVQDIEYYTQGIQAVYRPVYSDTIEIYIRGKKEPYYFFKKFHTEFHQIEDWLTNHNVMKKPHHLYR